MAGRKAKVGGEKDRSGPKAIDLPRLDPHRGIPAPPSRLLDKHGRACWEVAAKVLIDSFVLSEIDLFALEMMCRAYERWRIHEAAIIRLGRAKGEFALTPKGFKQMSAERISADRASKEYLRLAQELGATPLARIKTTGKAQGDFFDQLMPRDDEDYAQDQGVERPFAFRPRDQVIKH